MDDRAIRAELQNLLRYANKSEVARALNVSPQAVTNWSRGEDTSLGRLEQVRHLYGLDTQKSAPPAEADGASVAAPPKWAERLLAGVMALEKEAELTDADIAAGLAQARAVLDALGIAPGSPQQSDGGASASGTP